MSVSDHNSSLIYCANTKGIREMGGGDIYNQGEGYSIT